MNLVRPAWSGAFLCMIGSVGEAQIRSTFDAGAEGWTANLPGVAVSQMPSGGHPGGYLRVAWDQLQDVNISAPAAFTGNLSAFDHGTISFDGFRLGTGGIPFSIPSYGVVTIHSAAGTAMCDLAPNYTEPGLEWATYAATFDAASFGVPQSQWLSILSGVTQVTLSLSVVWGQEDHGIDNFSIAPVPAPAGVSVLGVGTLLAGRRRRRWR